MKETENTPNFVASDNSMIQQTSSVISESPNTNVEQRLTMLEQKMDTMTSSISMILAKMTKIENISSGDMLLDAENFIGKSTGTFKSPITGVPIEIDEMESDEMVELNLRPLS